MSNNPVQNPAFSDGFWHISRLFHPTNNPEGIVPQVNDAVLDWTRGWMRVVDVRADGVSTLELPDFPELETLSSAAKLFGILPGHGDENGRIYVDNTVTPVRVVLDSTIHYYGSHKKEIKIFRGQDISNPANVISARYDSTFTYISDTIPLELVATDNIQNLAVKAPKEGCSTVKLLDGELVTVVVYNGNGSIAKIHELLVKDTGFVVPAEAPVKRVTHIELVSPFLSASEPNVLEVPINVPLSSVAMMAKVHYTDKTVTKSIDGARVKLHIDDDYISTIVGQPTDMILTYTLTSSETSTDTEGGNATHVSTSYVVRSVPADGGYSVKLFVVPVWVDEYSGYKLDYYMYDLDRTMYYNVTANVELGTNSPVFDGLKYGVLQRITVAVDLSQVDARLKAYRHVQQFGISLLDDGRSDNTGWLIKYDLGTTVEYGRDLSLQAKFNTIGDWDVDLTSGITTYEEWIERNFYDSTPLFDVFTESRAPEPTHFILEINGIRTEYELAAWNDELKSITGGLEGKAAVLEWRRKVGGSVLSLGCSPLRIIHDGA